MGERTPGHEVGGMAETSETEDDLRTTSDAILDRADMLKDLEEAKRGLEPEDPELARVAGEIAEIGRQLEKATAAELELTQQLAKETKESPGSPERPIDG
jgi:hypothetical protein